MRYLGLALFAEGPTDHRFLRPVLRRLCEQLCAQHGRQPVEVGDVAELHTPSGLRDEPREQRIFVAGRQAGETWNIDAAPDERRPRRLEPIGPQNRTTCRGHGASGGISPSRPPGRRFGLHRGVLTGQKNP